MADGQTPQRIPCEESLDISTVKELHSLLVQVLAAKQPVVLEGAQVTRVDTAALQVLGAFFQDARAQEISVRWDKPSEALGRSAALLGLTELLDL
jgi:anti-anti-sigma regulatory factor